MKNSHSLINPYYYLIENDDEYVTNFEGDHQISEDLYQKKYVFVETLRSDQAKSEKYLFLERENMFLPTDTPTASSFDGLSSNEECLIRNFCVETILQGAYLLKLPVAVGSLGVSLLHRTLFR